MNPALFDVIELLIDLPEHSVTAGMQGTIVEEYGTAYEVEFCDLRGVTIALVALKPEQFTVIWQSSTQSWLPNATAKR